VTFSGDTTKSDNLITLAQNADILVHEAQFSLDDAYYHNRFPPNYLRNSHTSAEQVGEVAAAANAKHMVLSHYSPTDLPDSEWIDAIGKHYSGEITVARDPGFCPLSRLRANMLGDSLTEEANRVLRADLSTRGLVHRVGRQKLRADSVVVHRVVNRKHHPVGTHHLKRAGEGLRAEVAAGCDVEIAAQVLRGQALQTAARKSRSYAGPSR
jgi:hypothetical protein